MGAVPGGAADVADILAEDGAGHHAAVHRLQAVRPEGRTMEQIDSVWIRLT